MALALRNGSSSSCGCYRRECGVLHGSTINLQHGEGSNGKESPEYRAWANAKSRCHNSKHSLYRDYGSRGIRMCNRWRESFTDFLTDVGRRPSPQHSLDRIDNKSHYEPGNCRWATSIEQNNNTRRNRAITINSVTKNIGQWLHDTRTPRRTFYGRLKRGLSMEAALGLH